MAGLYLTHKWTQRREQRAAAAVKEREVELIKLQAAFDYVGKQLECVYAPILSHFEELYTLSRADYLVRGERAVPQQQVSGTCVDDFKATSLKNFHLVVGPLIPQEVVLFLVYCASISLQAAYFGDQLPLKEVLSRGGAALRLCGRRYLELKTLHRLLLGEILKGRRSLWPSPSSCTPMVVSTTYPSYLRGQVPQEWLDEVDAYYDALKQTMLAAAATVSS